MQKNDVFGDVERGTKLIENALNTFLSDKRINLTNQKYERIKKLLMVCVLKDDFSDDELSFSSIYNYLDEVFEYRKDYDISANAYDEAEEEIIRIIASADIKEIEVLIETTRYKKRFITAIVLFALIALSIFSYVALNHLKERTLLLVQDDEIGRVITASQEANIRSLVWKIVELENSNGGNLTHNAVYNRLKETKSITDYGKAQSYKKFNQAQYLEAVRFLEQWIEEIK